MKERTLILLKRLMATSYPLPISSLGEELRVGARTIRNELQTINLLLEQHQLPVVKTIRKQGIQLSLSAKERTVIEEIIEQTQVVDYLTREERLFDLILSFALSQKPIFLYQKEADYQISKSTMDEDMRRVREILLGYGINVLSMPKQGILLQGAERSIRTMLYDIINRSVPIADVLSGSSGESVMEQCLYHYLPQVQFRQINQLYDETISLTEETIYRNSFILFTTVWLSRCLRQEVISGSSWESIDTPNNEIRLFVKKVCTLFQLQVPPLEVKYLVFMLETFNKRDMTNSIEWVQAQLISIQLIRFVEAQTKIPFSRKEETLQEGLYTHIAGLINRVKGDLQVVNPLQATIEKNYGRIYQAIVAFIPEIEKVAGAKITKDEIAFLTVHFSATVSAINQELRYIYKAVVICNHGVATGKLLAESLKEQFNIDVLAVLSSRELRVIEKLDVDVVFSTLPLNYCEKPVLVVEPIIKENTKTVIQAFLTANQLYQRPVQKKPEATALFSTIVQLIEESGGQVSGEIYTKLEKTFDENQLRFNKRELQPMLKDVLKDSAILLQEEAQNWEEAIQKVAMPLLKDGSIEEQYIEAMIQSVKEYGPYIVIGKHLALAHARPEDGVQRLGVSVATLKEPVVFGHEDNDPVKIIFCLAAIDSYAHLNIMKSLITLINDEAKVEKLVNCTDIEAFKSILYHLDEPETNQ